MHLVEKKNILNQTVNDSGCNMDLIETAECTNPRFSQRTVFCFHSVNIILRISPLYRIKFELKLQQC
jgi:hypothetical protein